MRISYVILILLLITAIPCCTKKRHFEKEPNNTFADANEISTDDRILGFMNSPNDRDVFVLNIDKRGIIDIQVSGVKGINLAMKLWKGDTEPKLIKLIDDTRKSSAERFPNFAVLPGRYYIEIIQSDRDPKKMNKENAYELLLKSREAISEESEPNDSKDEANKIFENKEITGYFSPAYNRLNTRRENIHREEDWYVMDVDLKSGVPMLMDATLTGVSGIDSVLYVYDTNEIVIAKSDNGGIGDPEAITGAGIKKSGSYYIMVASKGYTANNDEPYTLNVTLREHDPGFEMEGNDDFESANKIVNNSIVGRMNSPGDRDMFLYQVSGPGIYRIELRPPEDMDAMFTLYNSDKDRVMEVNNAGRGTKEVYPNYYTDRDFYIMVSSKSGYELPKGEYFLSVTPFKNIEDQEREPNNDLSQANRIVGRLMTGYISAKGDKDYFLITSDARVREKFEVTGVKGGEIKVSVTDPMGYIIKSYDVLNDRKVVFTEMIDKKGYILIESIVENYDFPYTIKLKEGK